MSQGRAIVNGKKVLVAMGGNVASLAGDPRATILSAVDALRDLFGAVTLSALYQTPAFPSGSGPDFINAACVFDSDLEASAILAALHNIEATFGRTRTLRWGQRTLDLDLIACGQDIAPDAATYDYWRTLALDAQKAQAPDTLILPHPRLQDRPFVLIPLADVAPDWRHPVLDTTIADMVAQIHQTDRDEIRRI